MVCRDRSSIKQRAMAAIPASGDPIQGRCAPRYVEVACMRVMGAQERALRTQPRCLRVRPPDARATGPRASPARPWPLLMRAQNPSVLPRNRPVAYCKANTPGPEAPAAPARPLRTPKPRACARRRSCGGAAPPPGLWPSEAEHGGCHTAAPSSRGTAGCACCQRCASAAGRRCLGAWASPAPRPSATASSCESLGEPHEAAAHEQRTKVAIERMLPTRCTALAAVARGVCCGAPPPQE